jgi:hypothetical protein
MGNPVDVLSRIETYVRQHAGDKQVVRCAELRHADGLTLQVADRANASCAEKLVAPNMDAPKERNRCARFELNQKRRDESHADVDGTRGDERIGVDAGGYVLDVSETLAS